MKWSQTFCKAGFKWKVLLYTLRINRAPDELSYFPADYFISYCLFTLKIKAVLQHKNPRYIIGQIRRLTSYPVELIEDYIFKDFPPYKSLLYCDKMLDFRSHASPSMWASQAFHIHVFYIDVWRKYLQYLQSLIFKGF